MQDQEGLTVNDVISELTSSVQDAAHKPYLRTTIEAAVKNLGFDDATVQQGLDNFYDTGRLQ